MSELERKVESLTDAITKWVKTSGPTQVGASAGSTASVTGFVGAVVESSAKLVTGTYGISNGMADVTKTLGAAGGPLVGTLANIASKIGDSMIAVNNSLNEVGKSGINFDNNIGKFNQAIVEGRMAGGIFNRAIEQSGDKIAGLSFNAQKSAEVFLAVGKDFAESAPVRQLQATGIGMEELNKVLIISSVNRRNLDMRDENAQRRVAEAAASMAVEMDNVARLTGVSRQQQEKAIQDQMKKAEVEIMIASMSEQERSSYEKNTTALGKYGKEFQDVLTIYSTGGVRNAEDNAKVAAMGAKFGGLLEDLSKIKGDTVEDQTRRRQVQAQIDAEALRIAKDPEELKARAALATSAGEYGRGMAQVTVAVLRYGALLQKAEADLRPGQTVADKITEMLQMEQKKREAALVSLEPGAIINRTEMMIKDISAGAAKGFNDVNTKLVDTFSKLENFNKLLKPMTSEEVLKSFSTFINSLPAMKEKAENQGSAALEDQGKKKPSPATANAGGGDYFANVTRLVGERGPEIDMPSIGGKVKSNDELRSLFGGQDTEVRNMMAGLKNEMKTHLSEAKSSIPSIEQFEQLINRIATTPAPVAAVTTNDANNPLADHLQRLNTKMDELIRTVTSGSDATVRAVKTASGNLIA